MVKLNRGMPDVIFGEFGTLRDFSAQINLACGLGIVDRIGYRQLTLIRRVRNLFAHSNGYLTFDSVAVQKLLATELAHGAPLGSVDDFIKLAMKIEAAIADSAGLLSDGVIAQLEAERIAISV
jgi:DNA-binding MltR family transcriptional regulator